MDPREFHKIAVRLSAINTPVSLRTATSRAYYAVFNVAVELLDPIVPISSGAAAHGQVQKLLTNAGEADIIAVGSDLGELHSRRIDADYEMNNLAAENHTTVRATVTEAGLMIAALEVAFSSPRAISLKRTIQSYWTSILRQPLRGRPPVP